MHVDLDQAGMVADVLSYLRPRARALHRLNEARCNGKLTHLQELREKRLERECGAEASRIELDCYFQGDPRGWPLYLVPKDWAQEKRESEYNRGLAVPWRRE
jgi:hypothetical protein